jgi:hypothetical protein
MKPEVFMMEKQFMNYQINEIMIRSLNSEVKELHILIVRLSRISTQCPIQTFLDLSRSPSTPLPSEWITHQRNINQVAVFYNISETL